MTRVVYYITGIINILTVIITPLFGLNIIGIYRYGRSCVVYCLVLQFTVPIQGT